MKNANVVVQLHQVEQELESCPSCCGIGLVDSETCTRCEGAGQVAAEEPLEQAAGA